jgi:hypothetical protein
MTPEQRGLWIAIIVTILLLLLFNGALVRWWLIE